MTAPAAPPPVPDVVARIAAGRPVHAVWVNELGVADRWADLVVATLPLGWNYRGEPDDEFFAAYGVEPDPVRIDYYRRLWNAGD